MSNLTPLTEAEVKELAVEWYKKLDVHAPLEEYKSLLVEEGLEMRFPQGTFKGFEGFAGWYRGDDQNRGVIDIFFDEVHTLKLVRQTSVSEEKAEVKVIVKWEASKWDPPAPISERIVMDAYQTWVVKRSPKTKKPVIQVYIVDSMEYAPGSAKLNETISDAIAMAKSGDAEALEKWLEQGNDPNVYDAEGWTPLLWASVRGQAEAVALLLEYGADDRLPHRESGGIAVHLAGHSGSVDTAKVLLDHNPDTLNAVWDLNGHAILLQAVFYGHMELTKYLLQKGADTSITTARGLGPMELATQFQNTEMMELIKPYDKSAEEKARYYESFLQRIAPEIPPSEKEIQRISNELLSVIETGIKDAFADPDAVEDTLNRVKELVEQEKADVNRLGGPQQQPPLIAVVTGNNGWPANPAVERLRNELAAYLLDKGADPSRTEEHPMKVHTIIRASVFNHLDILKMCSEHMSAQELADRLNDIPVVNGLTALHDTTLRASMAAEDRIEGYLEQARWICAHGARSDIEDFAGRTQMDIAKNGKNEYVRNSLIEIFTQNQNK
ncbi:MAG: ankyrin repeat domain-containing protein [Xenococcaceae cyanobacterium]